MRSIELLSPAKNIECGLAAINHGADAVYIGASKFGARSAAGNSVGDIEQLATYAHKFNARVYAAVNTILFDKELDEAQKLIWQLYEAGADALIIQDMGILQMDLPPIALHASTQTDNRTVEKVRFFEQAGFSQVVLARELSLAQISEIATHTTVPLECFVHGALCVSYSGQCYISQALCGRSANRGECAQYCRLPYDLVDSDGNVLIKNKHLLSLKDLNLSDYLADLLEAGVSSFKIEGRLKEADYVKNITAYYRQRLDALLEGFDQYKKSSSGSTSFFFTPNPEKSFHRGSTSYFLHGRNKDIASFDTPKSVGERIGKVTDMGKNYFYIGTKLPIHNGDGLCYVMPSGELAGFRVNRVDETRIYPLEMPRFKKGTEIFRNLDSEFEKLLGKKSSERKIGVSLQFLETETGFKLQATDEDNCSAEVQITANKEPANNKEQALDNIKAQLSKFGNSDFTVTGIKLSLSEAFFIPSSILSEMRRSIITELDRLRSGLHQRIVREQNTSTHSYPVSSLSYLGNVSNHLAEEFYRLHGVEEIAPAFEQESTQDVPLMFTKHCLKYQLGFCAKEENCDKSNIPFAFSLKYKETLLALKFDCAKCEMEVLRSGTE